MRHILSVVLAACLFLLSGAVGAETQPVQQNRLKNALHFSGMDWGRAVYVFNGLANTHYYDTAVELLAATPSDGRFGYAIDTDVLYVRVGGSWVGLGSAAGILGSNGGTIGNETDNVWTLTENDENLTLTYAADLVTFASGTGATFVLTPATTVTGDLTLDGAAGALNFSGSGDSSVLVKDNDSTALVVGANGALDILGVDSTNGAEGVAIGGKLSAAGKEITESGNTDTTLNLTQTLNSGTRDASEDFTMLKATLTVTDDTGWASTNMLDLVVGSTSFLKVDAQGGVASNGENMAGGVYTMNGDHKGFLILEFDGTAVDYTANKINTVFLAKTKFNVTFTAKTGAATVAKVATGLDISAGTLTDNDEIEIYGSPTFATGRPMVVGQDPKFQVCFTIYFTDVSGSDSFFCGWRQAGEATQAAMGFTEFASIGHVSGAMYTQDEDGADADGTDTWGDLTEKELCALVSDAGVVTYTNDGAAPTSPGAQTLTDGLMVQPFCQLLHDSDLAEGTVVRDVVVSYTQP
jgi:hypothetical protein